MCCMTDGDPWSVKQYHWKSDSKEESLSSTGESERTYGQPSELIFPKRWPLSNPSRIKIIRAHIRGNITETLTLKTDKRERQKSYRLALVSNEYWLGSLNQFMGPTSPSVSAVVMICKLLMYKHNAVKHIHQTWNRYHRKQDEQLFK